DTRGHPIHRAGVRVDALFRPVDSSQLPVFTGLFVAGSLLAHQDWMRTKSGAGLAIGTAWGAVKACQRYLEEGQS
ncbi:MAG TPA: hypothetical protein PLJ27_23750, partial [Polyangiaceae bacterium]|nr:hypothetical protein [Polyangiaceae bacterium]